MIGRMPDVQRSALVPYSPMQMFELVADVERYPEFLAWVTASRQFERTAISQHAELTVSAGGLVRQIVTRNRLQAGEVLHMEMERGPFRTFTGRWTFSDLGGGCKVALALHFEFDNALVALAFNRSFRKVADHMVDDFCRRAEWVHG